MTEEAVDHQKAQALLQARARALARKPEQETQQAAIELLEFRLARERYALQTRHVAEVMLLGEFAPVPCTPDFVTGVLNVRGRIVAAIDIRRFFGLPSHGLADVHHVVLVRGGDLEFGLVADAVAGVRACLPASLQAAGTLPPGLAAAHLLGITDDRVLVIDMERVFADPRLVVREDATPPDTHNEHTGENG